MKRFRRFALLLALLPLAVAVAAPSADTRQTEAEIRRLDAARIGALLKGDLKALERLFSDELVYIHANGRIDTKKGYLGMLAGGMSYVVLQYDTPPQITVPAPTLAVVAGKTNIEARNKSGQVTKRVLTTTTVYARSDAGWQVVSYQGTPVP